MNSKKKPNILFMMLDSLRADKSYGDKRKCVTPNLDEMIQNGTYFTQAISPADGTILSIKSIFTSLLPFKTGTIKNKKSVLVDNKIPTITSILKKSGYQIFGKIPSLNSLNSVYSDFKDSDKYLVDKKWPRLEEGLGLEIIEKIKTNLEEPWFYYAHILDIHSKVMPKMPPLVIPQKYDNEKFGDSQYERAVSATDYWLGEILKNIDLDNTIVIISADHGSFIPYYQNGVKISLEKSIMTKIPKIKTPKFLNPLKRKAYSIIKNNEEGKISTKIEKLPLTEYEKRNLLCLYNKNPFRILYDEMIRTPLLFMGANIPQDKIINQQVSTRDILPTIIDILQLDEDIIIDGNSLFPLIKGKTLNEKPIFIQSQFPVGMESGYIVGIRTSKYKYNRSIDNPKQNVFLYDLENDPKEEENIANKQKNIVNQYENILKNYLSNIKNEVKEEEDKTEENMIQDELKKLGYI
jgi:arylsulfatase A-like enzyme|tara:strand:+ start:445 stop:1836 length:1392 start_codon:yes stop_codon:yes gene_type:complete